MTTIDGKAANYLERNLRAKARREGTSMPSVVSLVTEWFNGSGRKCFCFAVNHDENSFFRFYNVTVYPNGYRIRES